MKCIPVRSGPPGFNEGHACMFVCIHVCVYSSLAKPAALDCIPATQMIQCRSDLVFQTMCGNIIQCCMYRWPLYGMM